MTYLRCIWKHAFPNEPVLLFSELDDARWEVRKVEVFRNGHAGFASGTSRSAETGLSEVKVPSIAEINSDPQFEAIEISADEFEQAWARGSAQSKGT